jgi:hypothetical protein
MILISTFQVLLLGTIYTISRKYQNLQVSSGLDEVPRHFYHPLYQVLWLFIGMAFCLPLKNFIHKYDKEEKEDKLKKEMSPSLLIIPAFFDVCATIFDATGLIYVSIILYFIFI